MPRPTPPPLPANAFAPPVEGQRPQSSPLASPWDDEVVSSAPKPVPAKSAAMESPTWLGKYPIVHPEHHQGLEQDAAVNEFGMKMPREKAEAEAYNSYVKGKRVEAAAHHLSGMRAAHAAGDKESARKHKLMYDLHSKALGHDSNGPAHPDVVAQMGKVQYKQKFRPHHGDVFALNAPHATEEGAVSSAPAPSLGKSESLNSWAKAELQARKKKPCVCTAYHYPHRSGGGKCRAPKKR